jgi:hypothetical protein
VFGNTGAAPNHPSGLVGRSCRGLRTGHKHSGVSQEPERTCRLHIDTSWLGVAKPENSRPQAGVGPCGSHEHRRTVWYRQAKETKRGEKGGRKSEYFILPWNQGNRT